VALGICLTPDCIFALFYGFTRHGSPAVAKVDGDACVPSSSKLAWRTEVMMDECKVAVWIKLVHSVYVASNLYFAQHVYAWQFLAYIGSFLL